MPKEKQLIPVSTFLSNDIIERNIYLIRGKKVMFDRDLATLYDVDTGHFNQAVSRNLERFPEDFMFQLNDREFKNLISQFGISRWGGTRKKPRVFTEHGILMLSSALNSKRAIQVNIQIMRTFTKLRELIASNELIRQKIEELEQKYNKHDQQFKIVFEAIRELLDKPEPVKKRSIGFHSQ